MAQVMPSTLPSSPSDSGASIPITAAALPTAPEVPTTTTTAPPSTPSSSPSVFARSTSAAAMAPLSASAAAEATVAEREPSPARKSGRRPNFTATDGLIIAREAVAAKAHVAPYGEIQRSFSAAANKANRNKDLSIKVTAKRIHNRYKKIQDAFDRRNVANRRLSGVGGEIEELDELLSSISEARNGIEKENKAETAAVEAKEARKEKIGKDLVALALSLRVHESIGDGDGSVIDLEDGDESLEEVGSTRKKRRRRLPPRIGEALDGDMAVFGGALRDADLARVDMERERLQFERDRFEHENLERERDRAERREDREAQNALELDKLKVLMQGFADAPNTTRYIICRFRGLWETSKIL